MEVKDAKLLGRFHLRDKTTENLFICTCGHSNWIPELKEQSRKIECHNCSKKYLLMKKEKAYEIM